MWNGICFCGFKWLSGYGELFKTPGGKGHPGRSPISELMGRHTGSKRTFLGCSLYCVSLRPTPTNPFVSACFEYFIIYLVYNQDHPPDFSLLTFLPAFLFRQAHSACVFMFLLSIHGDLQLGRYSVYDPLCLPLTLLINCTRNTAISSLIAGRAQRHISSLSRIQKLWLPNFQRRRKRG